VSGKRDAQWIECFRLTSDHPVAGLRLGGTWHEVILGVVCHQGLGWWPSRRPRTGAIDTNRGAIEQFQKGTFLILACGGNDRRAGLEKRGR
jgi:hypothetical protein